MKDKILTYLRQELYNRTKLAGSKDGSIQSFYDISDISEKQRSVYEQYQQKIMNDLNEDTKIIESGIIDSFGLVNLRSFVEHTANVDIPDEMVTVETFATVKRIVQLIEKVGEK